MFTYEVEELLSSSDLSQEKREWVRNRNDDFPSLSEYQGRKILKALQRYSITVVKRVAKPWFPTWQMQLYIDAMDMPGFHSASELLRWEGTMFSDDFNINNNIWETYKKIYS